MMRSFSMQLSAAFFLALRYLRPRRKFVSVITLLSLLGVMLGVMVLVIVLSVMRGFERDLRDKIIGFNAHLTVAGPGALREPAELTRRVASVAGVEGASAYVQGPVLVQYAGYITTPMMRGVASDANKAATPNLSDHLIAGSFELSPDAVLVGQAWAARYGAVPGDKILIYAPRNLQALKSALEQSGRTPPQTLYMPTELVITGIFETGLYDYDSNFFVVSLETAQRLYQLDDAVHGLAVRVSDPLVIEATQERLQQTLPRGVTVKSWKEHNPALFNAIATERVVMSFVLFFIMIVAAFGLCSTLITITVQKSREIGLLKALGATNRTIVWIFLLHGLVVGLIGTIGGASLGLLVLHYRNSFRMWLERNFGADVFSPEIYHFPQIPAVIEPATIVYICAAAVGICVLAAVLPARAAAKLQPARSLRYE